MLVFAVIVLIISSVSAFPPLLPCERKLEVGTRIMANNAISSERNILIMIMDSDEDPLMNNSQAILVPNAQLLVTLEDWPTSSSEGYVLEIQTDCTNKPSFIDGDCGGSRKDGDFDSEPAVMVFPENSNCIVKIIAAYSTGYNVPVEITKPFVLPVE